MEPIQIAIVILVVVVILCVLGYYWYDNANFKRQVENNFNLASHDVITATNKAFILDAIDTNTFKINESPAKITPKDTYLDLPQLEQKDSANNLASDPLLDKPILDNSHTTHNVSHTQVNNNNDNDLFTLNNPVIHTNDDNAIPLDSAEAFFVKIDAIPFGMRAQYDTELDVVFDIVFEETVKIKMLPDISQFTSKHISYYLLDKNDVWQTFEHGKKYAALGLKIVVQLVDKDGIINHAQVANIYRELHRFVLSNNGHIRHSAYEKSLERIQEQVKNLDNIELDLELYLITKEPIAFSTVNKFFNVSGLINHNGIFSYTPNNTELFTLGDENHKPLQPAHSYTLFSIITKLHLQKDPQTAIEQIFDFGERFMEHFEARMLTTSRQILGQNEYDQLHNFIKTYIETTKKKQITLGSGLIWRVLS